jgi:hypothetical protein
MGISSAPILKFDRFSLTTMQEAMEAPIYQTEKSEVAR